MAELDRREQLIAAAWLLSVDDRQLSSTGRNPTGPNHAQKSHSVHGWDVCRSGLLRGYESSLL